MPTANPKDFAYNPATEAAPQIASADQLIANMNNLLSVMATNLPALNISDVDKGRVISVMDALARDRDTVNAELNTFRKDITATTDFDIEVGIPVTLYGAMTQFNSKLELHASNFAGHMTSLTSIEAIAKII